MDGQVDVIQNQLIAAGVGEGNISEFDLAMVLPTAIKITGLQIRLAVKHLFDTFPGSHAPGDVLEQHRQSQNAVKQLGGVCNGGHDIARGGSAGVDFIGACQQNHSDHRVHQGVDNRVHKREDRQYLKLGLDQIVVGFAKAHFFVDFPDAGLDDTDAGYILLHDGVNLIQLRLQL